MTEAPLTFLAFVMLTLIVADYADWIPLALQPWADRLGTAIWVVFALDFFIRLALAPNRLDYVRRHWLAAISVALPVFSVVKIGQQEAGDQLLLQVGNERIAFASFSRTGRSLRKTVGSHPAPNSGPIDAQLMTDRSLTYALGMQLFHRFKPYETCRTTRLALGIGSSCW